MEDYCRLLLESFLKTSFSTVKILVEGAAASKGQNSNRKVTLFRYVNGEKVSFLFSVGWFKCFHFFGLMCFVNLSLYSFFVNSLCLFSEPFLNKTITPITVNINPTA